MKSNNNQYSRCTIQDIRRDIEYKRCEPFTDEVFDKIVAAFIAYVEQRGLYSRQAVHKAIQRGWMTAPMAHFFKKYAAQ